MPKHTKLWIVLADGAHARVVARQDEAPGFAVVTEFDSADAHHRTRDLMSDRSGRVQESGYSGRHAIEPRTDPHHAEKMKFVRSLAAYLNAEGAKGGYDELVIFAPAPCLHELRESLDAGARAKVKHEAPRDLTKLPFAELPSHLEKLRWSPPKATA